VFAGYAVKRLATTTRLSKLMSTRMEPREKQQRIIIIAGGPTFWVPNRFRLHFALGSCMIFDFPSLLYRSAVYVVDEDIEEPVCRALRHPTLGYWSVSDCIGVVFRLSINLNYGRWPRVFPLRSPEPSSLACLQQIHSIHSRN